MHLIPTVSLYFILVTLVIVELLSFSWDIVSKFGFFIWIIAFGFLFSFAIACWIQLFNFARQKRNFLLFFTMNFFILLILLGTSLSFNSNSETTQEISCALEHISKNPNMGFKETCLFGYPARQFFFPSLPTLLLDRGTFQLNIGTAIYFITGIVVFSSGLFNFFKTSARPEFLASILISGLFHFYFVVWFLFSYEQSIYPLSFTMVGLGLFMHLKNGYSSFLLGLVAITNFYLIFMYTSGLASTILFIVFLIFASIYKCRMVHEKLNYLLVALISVGMIVASFTYREDLQLGALSDGEVPARLAEITFGATGLILNSLPIQYMSWFIYPLMLFTVFSIIFIRKRIYYILFIFFWIVCVIVIAIISKGYSYYVVEFRLHRSIIIIPFLLTIMGYSLTQLRLKGIVHRYLYPLLFVFLFITAIYNILFNVYLKIGSERHRHTEFINSLRQSMPQNIDEGLLIFDDNLYAIENFSSNYVSINDSLKYYLPGFVACQHSTCQNSSNKNVYYISQNSSLYNNHVKTFSFQNDKLIYITTNQ